MSRADLHGMLAMIALVGVCIVYSWVYPLIFLVLYNGYLCWKYAPKAKKKRQS